ncbi:MAG: hypothetical protein J6Y82_03475 [Bacteroidales bacterium]|nr:hypothetical protein [Bacteroidales bacterium]
MKRIMFLAIGLFTASIAFAQKGVDDGSKYGHGEDSVRCIQNLVMYGDAVKMKNYAEAYHPWLIVFNEAPLAKKTTLYTDGVKIVKNMFANEKDEAKREEFFKLMQKIYDQRIKYYGTQKNYPESYLLGMKGVDMLSMRNDVAVKKQAVGFLEKAINGDIATVQAAFVGQYILAKSDLFKAGEITAEQMIDSYVFASDAVNKLQEVATDKNRQAIEDTKVQVEQVFGASGAADCETLAKIFGPQLDEHKADKAWLTRINKLLSKSDCTESEFFYSTSECLYNIEPDASSARGLAKMYVKKGDASQALDFYNQAVNLETDNDLKAKYCYEIGVLNFSNNSYSAAKAALLQAAKYRENWGDPYLLLGKVYAAGASHIGEKPFEKQAGYWAAVDKFIKAKSVDSSESVQSQANELIRQYSQYFPKKEDLFFEGIQDGSGYTVGGFINERTTVRSKK